ncbi:MAG: type I methionyl aminopeptidase [Candidatus Dormibacteraceae bacterium]
MINLKTPAEIELMARAGRLLASVTEELKLGCRVGVRTQELDRLAQARITEGGARPGFLGYNGFPKSICVSINEEAVHGIPGRRRIEDGDVVSLDLGLVLEGFWADMGCTVLVGQPTAVAEKLVEVTDRCLELAVEQAIVGNFLGDISAAVQSHAEGNGFSVIRQFVGHGIGRSMHEDTQVPNFGPPGKGVKLKAGMTLAIEPMINERGHEVYVKPDGWTVCTTDGGLAAYVEHTVAITPAGPRLLTVAGQKTSPSKGSRVVR